MFLAPAYLPKQVPCNIYAAITMQSAQCKVANPNVSTHICIVTNVYVLLCLYCCVYVCYVRIVSYCYVCNVICYILLCMYCIGCIVLYVLLMFKKSSAARKTGSSVTPKIAFQIPLIIKAPCQNHSSDTSTDLIQSFRFRFWNPDPKNWLLWISVQARGHHDLNTSGSSMLPNNPCLWDTHVPPISSKLVVGAVRILYIYYI